MASHSTPATPACCTPRSAGPGRPKDPGKRIAILDAAKRLFLLNGFDGTSMDQIAAEAGVSKLTVYSHFGDKDKLFAEAVRAHCEQNLPDALFAPAPDVPLRQRLSDIGHAFYAMVMAPEAIAGHRILCSPQAASNGMPTLFWEAGPKRVQDAFADLLQRRIDAGELEIDDTQCAAAQFFTLLKGEPHAQAVFGFCCSAREVTPQAHVASVVDLFLRAYARR
ncbi:MAG: TetR/AcrR family transcriptional regulator [Thermomonas sp.]|uniref:TetR/AcrR family transcriptional regulator n=1 Tax=Thermomonas sp. TaxID=1971895 RepID=UPI0039E44B4C